MRASAFAVIALLLFAPPTMAESWVNRSSNFCLDTDGRSANGAAVRMWSCVNHPNQTWTVNALGGGAFRLRNRSSNYCLDTDGTARNGGQVRMWECVDHPNQTWEIVNLPDGQYRLRNKASRYCLDTDGVAANGAAVRTWACVSHTNQTWASRGSPEEFNTVFRTDTFGGPGGGGFELACPNATFMTGMRARSGAWVDALAPICSIWFSDTRSLREIEPQPFTGGGGGGESFIRCMGPRGVIVGVQLKQADNGDRSIGNINIDCGDFEQPAAFWNKSGEGASYFGESARGKATEERCGWGLVASGLYGKSGVFIDRLGLLCRRTM